MTGNLLSTCIRQGLSARATAEFPTVKTGKSGMTIFAESSTLNPIAIYQLKTR